MSGGLFEGAYGKLLALGWGGLFEGGFFEESQYENLRYWNSRALSTYFLHFSQVFKRCLEGHAYTYVMEFSLKYTFRTDMYYSRRTYPIQEAFVVIIGI